MIPDNPQSLNLYSYCYNNPLKYMDPTGNMAVEATVAATNWWNPIGWAAGVILAVEVVVVVVVTVIAVEEVADAVDDSKKSKENDESDNSKSKNKGPEPPSKLKDGDKVKTPDSHPKEFTKNKDGSYTHEKTGWTASKDKSGHGGPHWDMAPPKGSGHINVGPDGNIFGGSMK